MLTSPDLLSSLLHDFGRKEVNGSDLVLDAVLVEQAPRTSLWLAFDLGQLIESWEVKVRLPQHGVFDGGQSFLSPLHECAVFSFRHDVFERDLVNACI